MSFDFAQASPSPEGEGSSSLSPSGESWREGLEPSVRRARLRATPSPLPIACPLFLLLRHLLGGKAAL